MDFEIKLTERQKLLYQSKVWTHLHIQRFFFILTIFFVVEQYRRRLNYEIAHMAHMELRGNFLTPFK